MSERRFFVKEFDDFELYFDKKQEYVEDYKCMGVRLAPMSPEQIVDLLNHVDSLSKEKVELMEDCACQYRRIQKLESEIELFEDDVKRLGEENKGLREKVKRLQDIGKRTEEEKEHYADLYSEMEGDVIRLRVEKMELKDKIKELQDTNNTRIKVSDEQIKKAYGEIMKKERIKNMGDKAYTTAIKSMKDIIY